MSRSDRSHVPYVSGRLHPFHTMAKEMVMQAPQLREIRDKVRALGGKMTPSLVDMARIRRELEKTGDLERLKNIVRGVLKKEPTELRGDNEMPAAPPSSELYGRLKVGSEFLDVGSGTGKRLIQFAGQFKPTTMDPVIAVTRIDAPHIQQVFSEPVEQVTTSFMVLCNNKDQTAFAESDGIHVVPNVPALRTMGFGKTLPCGALETRVGSRTFRDYPCAIPATRVSPFYQGVNTYKRRRIKIGVGGYVGQTKEQKSIGTRVTRMPGVPTDCSLKYRGYQWKVRKKNGKAVAISRSGAMYRVTCDFDYDLDLDYEMTISGPRLIRVNEYRCYKPFHSLAALHHFCERIELLVDGMLVRPPEEFDPKHPELLERGDVEGLVYREHGEDNLVRNHQAFDIPARHYPHLIEAVEDAGFHIAKVYPHLGYGDEVLEVEVRINGDEATIETVGLRDKTAVDQIRNVADKLAWPTTKEFLHTFEPEDYSPLLFSVEDLTDEPESDEEELA